ncbi:CoA transferase [Gordonia sp. X0973]|uniref:CaiB/BaiF CoA transferase family protein n=1 Tax=Gordonia sp. X0973 TaxID=2742602 RepID=UPI000F52F586|nr:CaiB/BaiF CoA-transferase family protein [Gordonia sp. X0973]QKT08798.1 CoA transferase [Gordonia sp. X0973]
MAGPLGGVRVLVLAGMGPVPFVSMMLADMGAHVVRVDRPSNRAARALATTKGLTPERDVVNRGVDSIVVDLKSEEEKARLLELMGKADAFIEGYRPGVVERLGIGPDVALAANPRLVYARLTGYGQDGPRCHDAGHDINYVAQSGALQAMARHGEAPRPPINLLGDYAGGGAIGAFGIVCALFAARESGCGQVVDAAMVDGVSLLTARLHSLRGCGLYSDEAGTNDLDSGAPFYETYRCADGRYLAVGALEPDFYAIFLAGLGVDTSAWPEQTDRCRWDELRTLIGDTIETRTRDEWARVFAGTDACVSPVLDFAEAAAADHNLARRVYTDVDGIQHPHPAPRFSATPAREPARPPTEHLGVDVVARAWGV